MNKQSELWRILFWGSLVVVCSLSAGKTGLATLVSGSHHYKVGDTQTGIIRDATLTGLPAQILGIAYLMIAIAAPVVAWVISQKPEARDFRDAVTSMSRRSPVLRRIGIAAMYALLAGIAVVVSAVVWPDGSVMADRPL